MLAFGLLATHPHSSTRRREAVGSLNSGMCAIYGTAYSSFASVRPLGGDGRSVGVRRTGAIGHLGIGQAGYVPGIAVVPTREVDAFRKKWFGPVPCYTPFGWRGP
jgi:hypothetical protein